MGQKKVLCYNCGKEGHRKKDKNCPARRKKRAKCFKTVHFAACCKKKKFAEGEPGKRQDVKGNYRGPGRHEGHQQRGSTNQVVNLVIAVRIILLSVLQKIRPKFMFLQMSRWCQ